MEVVDRSIDRLSAIPLQYIGEEMAAVLLRYAEHQYAGDVEMRNIQQLWHDSAPRSKVILVEILGQPSTEGG